MAHRVQLACFLTLLTALSAEKDQSRWSRQISSYTADISDWVPLSGPVQREPQPPQIKRQAIAEPRILSEPFPGFVRPTGFNQEPFPSRMFMNAPANRQLYLQSVPSAPQNYLTDQGFGQSIRFGLAQPNLPMNQVLLAPQYNFDTFPQIKPRPTQIPSTQFKFDSIPIQNQPLVPQAKPFIQAQKTKLELPKFVDGYRVENITRDTNLAKKKPQSIPKIKFDVLDKTKTEPIPQSKQKVEREEVQLLYVPLESLNRGQFNFRSPLTSSQLVNTELFSQNPRLNPLKQNLAPEFQNSLDNFKHGQNQFSNFNGHLNGFDQGNKYSTLPTPIVTFPATTPKPKKLKPHQPPLAIFLTQESKKDDQIKVGDVLSSLKNVDTVAVLDSVNPANAPKVFIGPNSLTPPENYVKFELPYLSNLENSDKKLRQLPFFVAPLSYNTPQGFAKIPFPSPHVGSVVINSQIRETSPPVQPTTNADVIPNSYTVPPHYRPKTITQKPRFSYYSTNAPRTNAPAKYEPNYYSFEPQSVSTIKPVKESAEVTSPPKSGSYFLGNVGNQYNPSQYVNFPQETNYKAQDYSSYRTSSEPSTMITSTTTTTTKPPSTYARPLLETHNPYSINQAFHFSTPVDYQNFFDEYKENYATPGANPQPPQQENAAPIPTEKPNEEKVEKTQYQSPAPAVEQSYTEKPETTQYYSQSSSYEQNYKEKPIKQQYQTPAAYEQGYNEKPVKPQYQTPSPTYENNYNEPPKKSQYQPSPAFEQNYTPEIHYQSEIQPSRYPTQSTSDYTPNNEPSSEFVQPNNPAESNENNVNNQAPVSSNADTQFEDNLNPSTQYVENNESQPPTYENLTEPPTTFVEQQSSKAPYEYNQYETIASDEKQTSTSSTTTTTRRTPLRTRGRPRYSTTKSDIEYTTKSVVTRRPLRERKPLPPRPRYEPNKITTEKTTRKPYESNESTTKSARTRSRGRVHYKHAEADDIYEKRTKQNSKEEDLAYQRDVLHQNYPVTLMERMSTVDIEAMTEPTLKASSNNLDSTNPYDTENAYSNDQLSITQHTKVYTENKQEISEYSKPEIEEDTYVPRISSTRAEDYIYHSRSSSAPIDAFSSYDETKEEDSYPSQTTPIPKQENTEEVLPTESIHSSAETVHSVDSDNNDIPSTKHEDITIPSNQNTNDFNQDTVQEHEEPEENIVQTTPSYNRVRVRPGVIRQYHQASSTESSRVKNDRRKAQAITYRPAFDRRRTTMRIDEIEADLKTKQANSRLENQEIHPVYKPEPTTEQTLLSPAQDSSTKRGQFRRRRPSYTTTSTEVVSTKRSPYEVKNRFRGRRPTTEKPTEKPEAQNEATTSTVRSPFNRYSHRPRLSERFQKKPETETTEDQDSNYSLHRPKYAVPDTEYWSPKFSPDSFKPYNPNDVSDNSKLETSEQKTQIDELDIITAKNEYDDILVSVTPASNNKASKIPEIPPTLEALVEQSKVTHSDSSDSMSTFESMLEEVMKSLEEQDQDEYTKNVMKHKGGEIGEIPPEKIISSGESYSLKSTTPIQEAVTTSQPTAYDFPRDENEDASRKSRRRGFWKKVKVRPVTESIEVAESQYYSNTVNRLGQSVPAKDLYGKPEKNVKPRVTTYKPSQQLLQNLFENEDEPLDVLISHLEIPKINSASEISSTSERGTHVQEETTKRNTGRTTPATDISPGDMDLGTGSPDPTLDDEMYYTEPTESTISDTSSTVDRSDGPHSLMDFLLAAMGSGDAAVEKTNTTEARHDIETTKSMETDSSTEPKSKLTTTESTYIPEEITAELTAMEYETTENVESLKTSTEALKEEKIDATETPVNKIETSSISSFMDQMNIVSTSMSTEVSHETEICFRGKCIKTNKDIL